MYLINPSFLDLAKKQLNIKTSNDIELLKLRDINSCNLIDIIWRKYPQMKELTTHEINVLGGMTLRLQCYKFVGVPKSSQWEYEFSSSKLEDIK